MKIDLWNFGKTALRNVYDSFLKKMLSKAQIQNWFALVGRQEERWVNIPNWSMYFFIKVYEKLWEDWYKFKTFMETMVGFHKFIAPNAKK